ncbi:hypothetical protein APA_1311 [Pseudanabaena sp. lw0831]|uniref:hypothetical protein n=1 Tax=Pseudanabaena sp. lw0831 TaxID=1357935 RepID=UPI001915E135|nr:hypothetical protein [Pseudanabaena sp. lw0831]GBO53404.1 hypothetical protein APA_1311 [Pseudanabaena sp. lw0831]
MASKDVRDHIRNSYTTFRLGLAALGLLFPLILWWGGLLFQVEFQDSISAYYHTSMRDVFVGSLFSTGVFLYCYKGFTDLENYVLNFAGICAVLVSLFPTSASNPLKCETFTSPYLHGIFALLFFAAIAFVCIFQAPKTLYLINPPEKRNLYGLAYKALGFLMIGLPLLATLLLLFRSEARDHFVYFAELAGIYVFGAYWIVKTIEMRETSLDDIDSKQM